jgi:ribosomal protein S18 acetylase RimI-like enzyme
MELMSAAGLVSADLDQLTELLGRLVADGAALGWVTAPERAEIDELIASLASGVDEGEAAAAVARTGDRIAGFAYWRRYTRPTHRPHVDIEKVAVDPQVQGRGIGRGLMQALIAAANDRSVEVITLDLRGDNAPAIALYESLGFTRYGRLQDFVAVGTKRYDTLLYALDLRAASAGE